ncbi:DUF2179 domain-containing protein [Acetivibrio cellulolyticus]|uniref:DUF2179 domain-containing protein n=1 Tax=Acetivibrio cellulolyticus TaxID=35830 RepID=UPI0001E2DEEE|nr:DUF5698 domain-containing protein [Acetivibrio cellulolyticus]
MRAINFIQIVNTDVFSWVVLPLLIFSSRIVDVTIGTIRIIFVSRGKKNLAPLLGFFEVLVWITAISQIMKHLDNIVCYFAYAGGFAAGTFVGMMLEEKLAIGMLVVRVILVKYNDELREHLYKAGFGVTVIDAQGANGDVKIVYTIIKRKDLNEVLGIITKSNPKAFYSIEDARTVNQGVFRNAGYYRHEKLGGLNVFREFGWFRQKRRGNE